MDTTNSDRERKPLVVSRETSPEATSELSLSRMQNMRVLIVDDNYFARALLRNVLQALGVWMVAESNSAKEGIIRLVEEDFDLVLVDNMMPKVSGTAFTRTVRRSDLVKNQAVPIIMVSSYTDVRRIKDAVESGIHGFLAKPYSALALAQRLCACLDDERPFVSGSSYIGPCRRSPLRKSVRVVDDRREPKIADETETGEQGFFHEPVVVDVGMNSSTSN